MGYQKISNSVATHISTRTPAENKPMLQIGRERPLTLFHAIDQSSLSAPEKRPDRLLQEGMTLLFAGGETVAHSLSHIMFHLLDNPEIYSKIKRELDEATPMGETIPSLHTLERLPWLVLSSFISYNNNECH
jgi:cytochrome P450